MASKEIRESRSPARRIEGLAGPVPVEGSTALKRDIFCFFGDQVLQPVHRKALLSLAYLSRACTSILEVQADRPLALRLSDLQRG